MAERLEHEKTFREHGIDLGDVVDGLKSALDQMIESQIAEEKQWRVEGFVNACREIKRLRDTFAGALKREEDAFEAADA